MADHATCPLCGTLPPAHALEGLCVKCLGRLAFDDPSAAPPTSGESEAAPDLEAEFARLKPEESGERIGPYKLLQSIGEGGFGTVWMAEQERPVRRRVALKIIKLGMDTKEVIARFEQERQALAMMDHPNIAKVFDAGATQWGRPFFVMELVRGIKITDYCDQANLPTRERLALFIQTCHAVQHAHQKGIIHRDIKPSNVLVTLHDGVPVPMVIDFGVAKATQAQRLTDLTLFTQFEQMIGTPLYMSPEQAEMSGLDVDTRSDIYSLGVLLYELLTGRTPFDPEELMRKGHDEIRRAIREQEPETPSMFLKTMAAETRATVALHRQSDPAKLSSLVRGDLDWIVMKALEKDRSRRYETATSFARDIERHLADEPVHARPVSQLYRFRRLMKRNRLAFAAGGAVAAALLLALVNLVFSNVRIRSEKNQKDAALQQREAALADAKDRLFDALLQRARAGRFSGQMGQRLDSLEALAEAARIHPDERLRDEAIAAMALPDLRLAPAWRLDQAYAADANYKISAGRKIDGSVITVRSIPDRREIWRIDTGRKLYGLLMSGDGRFLAEIDQLRTLHVWRLADGRQILSQAIERCGGVAFTGDSGELAVGQGDLIVHIELATGREIKRWKVSNPVHSLAFRAVDRQLAVGYIGGTEFSIYDASNGELITHLPVSAMTEHVVAWHPDGLRLAISGSDPRIQIWDVPAKRRLAILAGHVQQVTALSFHPDGELLASNGWDAVVRLWHPASGRQLIQAPHTLTALRFSADGRWLGAAPEGDGGRLVEVAAGAEYRTIVSSLGAGKGDPFEGDVSPDGSLLALGMNDGARIWELASGRELAFLRSGRVHSAIFRPGGRELITCGDAGVQIRRFETRANGPGPLRFVPPQTMVPINGPLDFYDEMSLGPVQRIPLPFTPTRASCSHDGRLLAVISESAGGALVLDLATGKPQTSSLPHPAGGFVALSPDGARLATSGWRSPVTRFWDARTGKMIEEWKATPLGMMSFTPDSRTLIATLVDHFSFRDVQTLQPIHRLPRGGTDSTTQVSVSTDGKLIALEAAPGIIHLAETATGRTVARLTDPTGDRATWMSFTPDATQLVTASFYAKAIHVWDLRRIRARLKTMRLDWEWPEFPPAGQSASALRNIEVISGASLLEAGRYAEAEPLLKDELEAEKQTPSKDHSELVAALNRLATCQACQERFADAAALYREIVEILRARPSELRSDENYAWMHLATMRSAAGDGAGYRSACASMIERFRGSKNHFFAELVIKACSLAPDSGISDADRDEFLRKAQPMEQSKWADWYWASAGMGEYRAGRFRAAETLLLHIKDQGITPNAFGHAILALIQVRENQPEQARETFERARALLDRHWPPKKENEGGPWFEWLIARQLVNEADALLRDVAPLGK